MKISLANDRNTHTGGNTGGQTGGGTSDADLVPVYRLYNPNSGEHLYTMDEVECSCISAAAPAHAKTGLPRNPIRKHTNETHGSNPQNTTTKPRIPGRPARFASHAESRR